MTPEESIELLKNRVNKGISQKECDGLINLIEKQIPRKPLNPENYYTKNRCPSCGSRIKSGCGSSATYRNNWCNHCGQKIDWKEDQK